MSWSATSWWEVAALLFAAVAAAEILVRGVPQAWKRTIGRRRHKRRAVETLAVNAQLSWFEARLGPVALRQRSPDGRHTEHIWIDPLYYVQAITDGDDQVCRWAVTARVRRFRPTFRLPVDGRTRVQLGRTQLGAIEAPIEARAFVGARRWSYVESHTWGNPGLYCTVQLAATDLAGDSVPIDLAPPPDGFEWTSASPIPDVLVAYRARTVCDTYGLAGPLWDDDRFSVGPDLDQVRVLDL